MRNRFTLVLSALMLSFLGIKAQMQYYKPGNRLDISSVAAGTNVFIYSMCVTSDDTNYSRFITNSGDNATVYNVVPSSFFTCNIDHIWQIASVEEVTSTSGVTAKKITLKRRMGTESGSNYLGIGGVSSNNSVGNPQVFYVTQWKGNAYDANASKIDDTYKVCQDDGTIVEQSTIGETDPVYLVTAGTSKSFNTNNGTYNGSNATGCPIVFYEAADANASTDVINGLNLSDAPTGSAWADNTKWYRIKMNSRYVSTFSEFVDGEGNIKLDNTSTPADANALWCITGNNADGYKLYNLAKGPGYVFGISGSEQNARANMVDPDNTDKTISFDLCRNNNDNYWFLKEHGTTYQYVNNRDGFIAYWQHASATNADGSKFEFEAVDDISEYVAASQATMLSRLKAWENVPNVWATSEVTSAYNTLNAVTSSTTEILNAINTAQGTFKAALDGKRIKLQNNGSGDRSNRVLNIGASTCNGKAPVNEWGEVVTIKVGSDATIKLYNEHYNKYVAAPGNTNSTTLGNAGNYWIQVEKDGTNLSANKITLRTQAANMLHLANNGAYPLINWDDFNDAASHWTVTEITDVEPYNLYTEKTNLQSAIDGVNTWLTTFGNKLINQAAASLTALRTQVSTAQAALTASDATSTSCAHAKAALETARTTMFTNLLSEASPDQQFRLRSDAFDKTKYLTETSTSWGGMKVQPLNSNLKAQTFKFQKGENGFELISVKSNQAMAISGWNIAASSNPGNGYQFYATYVGDELFTITQRNENAGRFFAPGVQQADGTATIYSDQQESTGRTKWVLEPISADDVAYISLVDPLIVAIAAAAPYENFYDADKAGLPGYLESDLEKTATEFDRILSEARTALESTMTEELVTYHVANLSFALNALKGYTVVYPENRYFSIKNVGSDNRGYVIYKEDATAADDGTKYLWTTAKSGDTSDFDAANANHLWCFLNHTKVDGTTEHYLYNAGLKKYARPTMEYGAWSNKTYNQHTWIFSDEPAAIELINVSGHSMRISAYSSEAKITTGFSVNIEQVGPVISYYAEGDNGVPFSFDWGTVDFVANDTTDVAALVRTPITLRTVAKDANPLITGLDNNQSICTYSSTKAFRVPTGVTAYYATEKDARNIVRLKAVPDGIVPANQGVLLVGAVNKTKAMLDVDYRTEVTADVNIFRNTASGATEMGANCYILAQTAEQGIGFYHATPGTTLSQGKAYLDFSGSPVRAFTLSFGDDDVTTGISSINAGGNAENAPVYDLSGRRIAEPLGRGIYIKNGKKYFVK